MPVPLATSSNMLAAAEPAKNSLLNLSAGKLARFDSVLVPTQVAATNTAIVTNGIHFNLALDSVATAGIISTIGQPVGKHSRSDGDLDVVTACFHIEQAPMLQNSSPALPITNLSDLAIIYPAPNASNPIDGPSPVLNLKQPLRSTSVLTSELNSIDLSLVPLGSPATLPSLSSVQNKATLIDGIGLPARAAELSLSQGAMNSFVAANLATLNLAMPAAAAVSTTAAAEPVLMQVTGIQMSAGITVSGTPDAASISMRVTGDVLIVETGGTNVSAINLPTDMSRNTLIFASDLAPLALNEGAAPAGFQVRLIGTLTLFESDMPPGNLILGG